MAELKPCGTEAAYQRHIRRHEIACDPCLRAAARGRRLRYAARNNGRVSQDILFRELIALLAELLEDAA